MSAIGANKRLQTKFPHFAGVFVLRYHNMRGRMRPSQASKKILAILPTEMV